MAARLLHTEVNKVTEQSRCDSLCVSVPHSLSVLFTDQKHSSAAVADTLCCFLSGAVVVSVCGDTVKTGPLIPSQGCHAPPQIHHTVWFPLRKYMYFPTSPWNEGKTVTSFTATVTMWSQYAPLDVLSTSAQPPQWLSAAYKVERLLEMHNTAQTHTDMH